MHYNAFNVIGWILAGLSLNLTCHEVSDSLWMLHACGVRTHAARMWSAHARCTHAECARTLHACGVRTHAARMWSGQRTLCFGCRTGRRWRTTGWVDLASSSWARPCDCSSGRSSVCARQLVGGWVGGGEVKRGGGVVGGRGMEAYWIYMKEG